MTMSGLQIAENNWTKDGMDQRDHMQVYMEFHFVSHNNYFKL